MTFEPMSHWQPTILYDVVVGSHLYGTNHAGSDYDTRFVFAPRIGQVLGISKLEEVWRLDNEEGQDREGKELRAWVRQLLQGNPNLLDQLFAPPECVRVSHPAIQHLLDNKQLFLGQHVRKPFCEMARAHLHWLRDDIEKKPRHGRHTPRIELIAKYGYDTKDGAHLVRLLLKIAEILREGTYRPRLDDAQRMMVRAILTGEWTVEQVIAWADQRHAEVEAMTSNLLPGPALVRIEELTIDVLSSLYGLRS